MTGPAARLAHLELREFRNFAHAELAPPAAGLVLIGDNGQGKTNVLESIAYLQILRSVRGARDQDLVRFGADAFHIAARAETDGAHEIGVGFERASRRKRVRLDGVIPPRLSDALGALPSVMFSPADVELIAGAPSSRRRFLDIMLALTSRGYLSVLQRYRGALAQRNAALREAARTSRATGASITIWEPTLVRDGAAIIAERRAWMALVADRFTALCRDIGETGTMQLRYASTIGEADDPHAALEAAFDSKRSQDVRRGLTHAGPHRDDVVITLDGRELRTFGSAGQQRTAAIALRMLEASTFTERMGRAPVFLLDDPFAELDVRRAARILELLTRTGAAQRQTILAVPREHDIPRELTGLHRVCVRAGTLSPASGA